MTGSVGRIYIYATFIIPWNGYSTTLETNSTTLHFTPHPTLTHLNNNIPNFQFIRIMAIPALISFYVLWVISMLLRPVFVISVGLLLWNFPSTVLKFKQVVNTAAYMFLTNDKKYKKLPDPNMDDFKVKVSQ